MDSQQPIAVIDSGLGGLTVVRALADRLPNERIIYFGDTARLPYGSKSPATITSFLQQIIKYLLPFNPKHILIACNTATALALPAMRKVFPQLSISGVVEPGAKAAVIAAGPKPRPVIGVIATEATIRSKAYDRAILRKRNFARVLLQPTPLLVPMIEEGRPINDPLITLALQQYLDPMLKRGLDVLVLGCTHYPILKPAIANLCASKVAIIDSATRCAEDVAHRLRELKLPQSSHLPQDQGDELADRLSCYVTDNPPRFAQLALQFLGVKLPPPICVSPDLLYDNRPQQPASVRHAG